MRFELLPIHDVFAQFQHVLQPLFAGTSFGLAEENLQPRIRGTLLMALSNKFGALVLTTGNKSEMATGVLHSLRRYGGCAGSYRRCDEDAGVCAEPFM